MKPDPAAEPSAVPWDQLSNRHKEWTFLLMYSIEEFASGVLLHGQLDQQRGHFPSVRFLLNSLYVYLHGYYTGAFGALPLMEAVGRPDLIRKAKSILDTPVGDGTFRDHLSKYRSEMYTHAKYTFKHHEAAFSAPEETPAVKRLFEELTLLTIRFLDYLRFSYPEVAAAIASTNNVPPVDNPPSSGP